MKRSVVIFYFIFALISSASSQSDFAVIHFYRLNSLREPKGSDFEIFLSDKQTFLLSIGARVDYKIYSEGRLKINGVLSSTFRKTCNTTPVYLDVKSGQEYYVRVDGVSCICLIRSDYDGPRDLLKDYDFSSPTEFKEENIKQRLHEVVEKTLSQEEKKVPETTATPAVPVSGYTNKNALIIGNSSYSDAPLRNPANDAKAIAVELKKLGFDVMSYTNLNKISMKNAIREFEEKVNENKGVAVFYYAGHGLQANGSNWLVPVDAKIEREYDIEDVCVKADMVLRMLEINNNPMNIVILDACRNNPFAVSGRSLSRGLAQPENAPKGSIIAFATAPGKTASDGDGANGLYTQELIKALRKPGLSVEQIFKEVRVNVINISKNQQTPWENSSLLGDFYFKSN